MLRRLLTIACFTQTSWFACALPTQAADPAIVPTTSMRGEGKVAVGPGKLAEAHAKVTGLVLSVEDAGGPTLTMPGAIFSVWEMANLLAPYPITFGAALTGKGMRLADQQPTAVSNTLRFEAEGGGETLTMTVSRLSPAVLIDSGAKALRLFAPEPKPFLHRTEDPRLRDNWYTPQKPEFSKRNPQDKRDVVMIPPGAVKPLRWAAPTPDGKIATGVLGTQELPPKLMVPALTRSAPAPQRATAAPRFQATGAPWLLLWYGSDSPFVGSQVPFVDMPGYSPWVDERPTWEWVWPQIKSVYQADVPMLLVFESAPAAVRFAPETGIELEFAGKTGKLAIMPLYGHALLRADDTEKWLDACPPEVAAQCASWAEALGEFPVDVEESAAYDAEQDVVTFTERVQFTTWRPGGRRLAPLPAMLALGTAQRLPVEVLPPPVDMRLATWFGPVFAVPGDRYTWRIRGLGSYVTQRQAIGPPTPQTAALEQELAAEVQKILAAGHLAPLLLSMSRSDRRTTCWRDPSETLASLAGILVLLPHAQQTKLREYLAAERTKYPPETTRVLKIADGARREWHANDRSNFEPGPGFLTYGGGFQVQMSSEFYEPASAPLALYRAYGLARYYEAMGAKPEEETLVFCRQAFDDAAAGRQWDTLGWFQGKYASWRGWVVRQARQHTLRCVHRDLAGLIGYLRLCRLAGQIAPPEAWGQYARLAALRFAMARYGRYLAAAGIIGPHRYPHASEALLPDENPANPGTDLRNPDNYIYYQIFELHQHEVILGDGATVRKPSPGAYHLTFLDMTPETARLLGDWGLKEDVRRYLERYAQRQPNWYAAYTDVVDGEEIGWNYPSDPYQLFMAHAWIAGTAPETLEKWLDVPWTARGDLFFLDKLATVVKRCRGVNGER